MASNPSKANKRSASQRAADLKFIATHHLKGKTHAEIAEMLSATRGYTLSRQQVTADLKKLATKWLSDAKIDFALAQARELEGLRMQEIECWKAWDKSTENFVQKKIENIVGGSLSEQRKKISITETTQCGNPAYMSAILGIRVLRWRILDLCPSVKSGVNATHGSPSIQKNPPSNALPDPALDEVLRKVFAFPALAKL